MENDRLALPEQKNYDYAYGLAHKLAIEQLAGINDIEQQCRKSGTQYQLVDFKQTILIQYLNQSYRIALPSGEISLVDSAEKIPIRDKLLILHYLISAKGTPPANKLITFRELPEGSVYFPTFSRRTIKPILGYFGKEPHRLIDAGGKLGGHTSDYGDTAVTINAFSHVPITIILWGGDDEFTPQGSIVFDATISDYLPTEDITVLCGTVAGKLISYLR
jgi:hypothetical protein